MRGEITTARSRWRHYAWAAPAILGLAAVGFLCWGAWIYGYQPGWLGQGTEWWRVTLGTSHSWTLVITICLWLAAFGGYWWPRRRDRVPIGLIVVVVMVILAAILGVASYLPCRGHVSAVGVMFWVLQLYVGQPPNLYQSVAPGAACQGQPPLALQLGQMDGLGATLIGAVAVASVLWRQPVERLRSRFAQRVTVFTGLDELTLPLLIRLTDPAAWHHVIVIEPDETHPLLDEARATGARLILGNPAAPGVLRPVLSGWRGSTLERLYALRADATENDAVLDTVRAILGTRQQSADSHPHLVTRIDDPRHANHWRGSHGANLTGFEDALSPAETAAYTLVDALVRTSVRRLIVCGDSRLTLATLIELDRRNWEQRELVDADAAGRRAVPGGDYLPPPPVPLHVGEVILIDPRAADVLREFRASTPRAVPDSMVTVRLASWETELMTVLDAMSEDDASDTAVIVAASLSEEGMHLTGRAATLHPNTWIYVQSPSAGTAPHAVFNRLRLFRSGLLVGGDVPEDTWMRVARHWHECFRLQDPVPPDHPKAPGRRPWAELSDFLRHDNLLQVRSILSEVADLGRQWVPTRMVPSGSHVELSYLELQAVAMREHARWYGRRQAAARAGGGDRADSASARRWDELPDAEKTIRGESVRSQVRQLEEVGFMPIIRPGGPPGSQWYERVGTIEARQLSSRYSWLRMPGGEQMHGEAGDWRVIDDHGHERTVGDSEFRAAHAFLDGRRWRRTGTFRAWQVDEALTLRTKEGTATTTKGDWVVEGVNGERWPVSDQQFKRSYKRIDGDSVLADQASAPAATSSSTAPAISS